MGYDLSDDSADIRIRSARYSDKLEIVPTRTALDGGRRVILIHGYNSPRKKAMATYITFLKALRKIDDKLESETLTLTWPSGNVLQYETALNYVRGEAAEKLAEHIKGTLAGRRGRLVLVGHSMGCRLILEAIHRLPPEWKAVALSRLSILMMAAAVPTAWVSENDDLQDTINNCRLAKVYYSPKDWVLEVLFPQEQKKENPRYTEAVGEHGGPRAFWTEDRRQEMPKFTHGCYWTKLRMVEEIARTLGARPPRRLPEHALPDRAVSGWEIAARTRVARKRLSRVV